MGHNQDNTFGLDEESSEELHNHSRTRTYGWTALHQSDSEIPEYAAGLALSDGKKISIGYFQDWSNLAKAIKLRAVKVDEVVTRKDNGLKGFEADENLSGYFDFSYNNLNEGSVDYLLESETDSLISDSRPNEIAFGQVLIPAVNKEGAELFSTTWKEKLFKILLILGSLTSLSMLGMGIGSLVGLAVGWPVMVGIASLIGTVALYAIASVFIGQAVFSLGLALLSRLRAIEVPFTLKTDEQIVKKDTYEQTPQNLSVSASITKPDELHLIKQTKVHKNLLAPVIGESRSSGTASSTPIKHVTDNSIESIISALFVTG